MSNWNGRSRKPELPPNWDSVRRFVLKRDRNRCRWLENGVRCMQLANEVDHIRDRDDHRPENLQSLCGSHHRQKTATQYRRLRDPEPHPGMIIA